MRTLWQLLPLPPIHNNERYDVELGRRHASIHTKGDTVEHGLRHAVIHIERCVIEFGLRHAAILIEGDIVELGLRHGRFWLQFWNQLLEPLPL